MSISFERLGVRMLRREDPHAPSSTRLSSAQPPSPSLKPPTTLTTPGPPSSRSQGALIASFMLYGLAAEGKISSEISIRGRLDGIHVRDLTPAGRRYPDILTIGVGGEGVGGRKGKGAGEGETETLSFSIHRSPQRSASLSSSGGFHGRRSDVHLFVHVPAIHYLHSVNFVLEMELFVSDFLKYITLAITDTFKSAAVGVAKGLVRQESQLVRSISILHTSFGHDRAGPGASADDAINGKSGGDGGGVGREETDSVLPFRFDGNRLYYDISVQSPVIVLPTSLSKEDCLVAHLGEITVKNEYLSPSSAAPDATVHTSPSPTITVNVPTPGNVAGTGGVVPPSPSHESRPSVERMTLAVSNISLHTCHTAESRLRLSSLGPGQPCPARCTQVLREVSVELQIDKHLAAATTTEQAAGRHQRSPNATFDSSSSEDADLVIGGRLCGPLLIHLPKGVFDQLRATLKHGIRKEPRLKSRPVRGAVGRGQAKSDPSKPAGRAIRFDPVLDLHGTSGGASLVSSKGGRGFPTIFASFSLPKLSLELTHLVGSEDRSLVYICLDDLSAQYHQSDINFLSLDLALKSIAIEDLLQPIDSEYRNILTSSSSTKAPPVPFSPVVGPAPSPASSSISGKTSRSTARISGGAGSPMAPPPFFPLSHLMSTPKPPQFGAGHSPLRSFCTSSEKRDLFGQSEKKGESPSGRQDETGSTIKEEASTFSEAHKDLLTVQAFYVSQKHPQFKEKYDSVSLDNIIVCVCTWCVFE